MKTRARKRKARAWEVAAALRSCSPIGAYFQALFPITAAFWPLIDFAVSFGITTVLFAMIFKILPDVYIKWSDVWIGAAVTAALFAIGKIVIGLYLGRSAFLSAYGAAGSLAALLIWLYYSAQIFLFGAELTKAHANRFGSHIVPASDAVPLTEEARAQQGIPRSADLPRQAQRHNP